MGDAAVVVRPVDGRNEFVVRVVDVLVILAVFVAVVRPAIQKGDDERVLEPQLERIRVSIRRPGTGHQLIPEQRIAARAVDHDVSPLKQRHHVLRREDGRGTLHRMRLTRIDESAEGALDVVERAESERPPLQQSHQVRRNGLAKREALLELRWLEDGLDALAIDVVGTVVRDRIGHEVRRELDHTGPSVVGSLFIEVDGEPVGRLKQCRQQETHGACAEDVDSGPGGQSLEGRDIELRGHSRARGTAS